MHSERCSASNPLSSESINNAKWSILFPESEIVTEEEPVGKEAPGTGLSPDQLAAFMETSDMTDTGLSQEELEDEAETQVDVDAAFLAFQKRISLEPEQVLRVYPRDSVETEDHPLWLSDLGKPSSKDIPSCPHCQSPRTCEVQIMPQILTHLELDHTASNALDFGSLFVYSCSNKDCVPDLAFVEECVWKQDFSLDGMGDSQRKAAAMECNEAPEL